MRVSSFDQYHRVQTNLNKIQTDMSSQQFKIATGVKYQRPSDAPVDVKQLEVIKHSLGRIEQYQKNSNDAMGILETVETQLNAAYGILDTVNQTSIQAMNDTYTPSDLKALSRVVENSIQQLVSLGNTKHLGKYVFAGEDYTKEPFAYDGTTVAYNGSDKNVDFQVSPYINTTVVKSGDYVIKKSIEDLIKIRDQIMAGDKAALTLSMEENQKNMDAVSNYQAETGVDAEALTIAMESFNEQSINLEQRRSLIEDVDYAKLMVDYSMTQRTYEGTLKATSMMFQTSILNYI